MTGPPGDAAADPPPAAAKPERARGRDGARFWELWTWGFCSDLVQLANKQGLTEHDATYLMPKRDYVQRSAAEFDACYQRLQVGWVVPCCEQPSMQLAAPWLVCSSIDTSRQLRMRLCCHKLTPAAGLTILARSCVQAAQGPRPAEPKEPGVFNATFRALCILHWREMVLGSVWTATEVAIR